MVYILLKLLHTNVFVVAAEKKSSIKVTDGGLSMTYRQYKIN